MGGEAQDVDRRPYRQRNVVGPAIARLEPWRCVATRYDETTSAPATTAPEWSNRWRFPRVALRPTMVRM